MPVAVGRVGELDRDVRLAVRPVVARAGRAEVGDGLAPDEDREEVVDDQPLVVPAQRAASLVEELRLERAVLPQAVDEPVVRADERDLQLAHERVDVVPRVADQRDPLLVARQVAVVLEQLRRIVALVEVRRPSRPASVKGLEVGSRHAHVAQRGQVGVRSQGRAVGGEVVRHVLPEERPARLHVRVLLAVAAVAEAAGRADPVEQLLVDLERRQVEHPPVAPSRRQRRIHALGGQAVVADCRCHVRPPMMAWSPPHAPRADR